MNSQRLIAPLVVLAAMATVACETSKSANPLSPDIAGPLPGVEITAPKTLEPANGQQIVADGAPQSLLIENAGTNGPRPLFLQVEVGTDATFQQLLHQADRVTPGPDGRTVYRLPEPLGPGHTYYWRARAADGANSGPYSSSAHFAVVEPVIIEPPTPLEPQGAITTNRPNFVVRNGATVGPVGAVIYRFEVGTSDTAPPAVVVTATPGGNGTTTITLGDLPFDRTLYWRVWATNGVVDSPYSGIVSFRTPAAPAPPPAPPPPPGGGGGGLPGGSGGRTPDPPPGQRLPLPHMAHVVQQVAAARPDLLRNSCQEHGGSWGFMDVLVDTLRTYDTRWGYNWKRGNVGDPSHDVVDYHWGAGPSEGSTQVYIIDVITGHCGSNPGAGWGDVTDVTYSNGGVGRWTGRGRF
ncbi:MAG TPA: hypothetical protein VMO26_13865 [Vicinamibacterales bacterium]|nr:hypothetical protein [Vicinamibacterales bacterium]